MRCTFHLSRLCSREFQLGEGLFEIRNNSLNMYPVTSSITGGIIKAGAFLLPIQQINLNPQVVVELINEVPGHYIQVHSTNYFNNLTINQATQLEYPALHLPLKRTLPLILEGLIPIACRFIWAATGMKIWVRPALGRVQELFTLTEMVL